MDELEIFKKQWKREEKNLPRLEFDEIYQMILKRSSSAVKWIFIISMLELVFGILITITWHPSVEKDLQIPPAVEWISWLVFPVTVYFIFRFFKNYRRVSTTSSVKGLLSNIVKARKTVRLYIIINLAIGGIMALVMMVGSLVNLKGGWTAFQQEADLSEYMIIIGISFGVSFLIVGILLLIYLLLYGLLMRNLVKNYKELKKMEL